MMQFVILSTELVRVWTGGTGKTVTSLVLVIFMVKDVFTGVVSNRPKPAKSVTRKKERKPALRDIVVLIVSLNVILFGMVKNVYRDVLVSKRTRRSVTRKKDSVSVNQVFVDQSTY